MNRHVSDPGVFIRSVASGGHLGGLSLTIPLLLDAVDAAGWPIIVLETVGAGQSETEIVDFADVKVVLNAPGLGDDVQAIKAGVLEIADVLVVNKSDLPFADQTKQQMESMLQLRSTDRPLPAVVGTSAVRAEGITELARAIRACTVNDATPEVRVARRLRGHLARSVEAEIHSLLGRLDDTYLDDVCARIREGSMTMPDAIEAVLAACICAEPTSGHGAGMSRGDDPGHPTGSAARP
jgi:LAO/AO transport system kinase